jgi:VanZ family protein
MIRLALAFAACIGVLIVLADMKSLGPLYAVYDFPYGDKIGHITLYGTLALLIHLAAFQVRGRATTASVAVVSAAVICLVSLEELSQVAFPARTVDVWDLFASYIGVAYATCFAWLIVLWRRYDLHVGRLEAAPVRSR